ncbi:hypothetical protein ACFYYS_28240 [Streptomyces sp. NPDC002120]
MWSRPADLGGEAPHDGVGNDVITDLDSDYAAYAYVSSVGIGA